MGRFTERIRVETLTLGKLDEIARGETCDMTKMMITLDPYKYQAFIKRMPYHRLKLIKRLGKLDWPRLRSPNSQLMIVKWFRNNFNVKYRKDFYIIQVPDKTIEPVQFYDINKYWECQEGKIKWFVYIDVNPDESTARPEFFFSSKTLKEAALSIEAL